MILAISLFNGNLNFSYISMLNRLELSLIDFLHLQLFISIKTITSTLGFLVTAVHYVHFVKYDVTVSFYDAVSDTIRRRGGDRGIFTEEGVDTVAYFRGNHGFRV